ncbi:MAG: hypothetical protein GF390_03440 [Candidatus Pacebacteria bacterium]|nr:hypothetical protein [Candidatus Paceibacterota bacterium]
MKFNKIITTKLKWLLSVLILTTFGSVIFYYSLNKSLPFIDSGVFLYIGWLMNHGLVPYKDIWDHKAPLILMINYLAMSVSQGQLWGLWLVEYFFQLASWLTAAWLLGKKWGRTVMLIAILMMIHSLHPQLFNKGNFAQEYALVIQFMSVVIYWLWQRLGKPIFLLLQGLMFTLLFLLQPNLIAVQVAVVLALLIQSKSWSARVKNLAYYGVGALVSILVIVSYFAYHQALTAFWDQVWHFNSIYSQAGFSERVKALLFGLDLVTQSGLVFYAGIGAALALKQLLISKNRQKLDSVLLIAVIWLPMELLFTLVSGRSYRHYFMTWLPVLTILTAYALFKVQQQFLRLKNQAWSEILAKLALIIMVFPLSINLSYQLYTALLHLRADYEINFAFRMPPGEVSYFIDYLQQHTQADDYVLMWSGSAMVNYAAKRRSPTRYAYLNPLFTVGYTTDEHWQEFWQGLKANKPVVIIDYTPVGSLTFSDCSFYDHHLSDQPFCDQVKQLRAWVKQHYRLIDQQEDLWALYQIKQ